MKNTKEQNLIENEWKKLELLAKRAEVAKMFLDLRDNHGNLIYKPDWVKKNIMGVL